MNENKKLVVFLNPFNFSQKIILFENGNKIEDFKTTTKNLKNDLLRIGEDKGINDIDFVTGAPAYVKKIIEEIKEAEIVKYNKTILNINII